MEEDLKKIEEYLNTHLMDWNEYRVKVGDGRSQNFGKVYKRNGTYGYSRQCRRHPELWYLLEEFGRKWISVEYTGIQVNQNYSSKPHKDIGNIGDSEIVGLGEYEGGYLCIEEGGQVTDNDIRYKILRFNGSKKTHWTKPWEGHRYSLVYHTTSFHKGTVLPEVWIPVCVGDKWYVMINDGDTGRLVDYYGKTVDTVELG